MLPQTPAYFPVMVIKIIYFVYRHHFNNCLSLIAMLSQHRTALADGSVKCRTITVIVDLGSDLNYGLIVAATVVFVLEASVVCFNVILFFLVLIFKMKWKCFIFFNCCEWMNLRGNINTIRLNKSTSKCGRNSLWKSIPLYTCSVDTNNLARPAEWAAETKTDTDKSVATLHFKGGQQEAENTS